MWIGGGNCNQRDGGYGYDRGVYRQDNRGNDRQGNPWNNRGNNRQENRQQRQQRSGFGKPFNYQRPNVQHKDEMTEAQSHNNFNDRARPKDKNHDDHMRDSSPDRQDRSRPKDKKYEDYARDPSPDSSLPEHCIHETLSFSTDAATQDQSQQVQSTAASGSQGIDINQQGLDNQNMEWNAQPDQGKVFYDKNQREQDYRPQYNNRGYGNDRGGYRQYNRDNDRQGYQWNNRDNYRQYNNQDERPQRSGFGISNYQGPNVHRQEDLTKAQSHNNFSEGARPKDKNLDDHMRDSSPDRLERSWPKDKNYENYARDPSPDRSLQEHCIQETLSSSPDATNQDQSQQAIRANQGHTINLLQLAKVEKEKDVKSTVCNEEEEFPNSSDFVYDLEDSTNSSCTVREDSLGQRVEFDQTVKISKVPIGWANQGQVGKGKKKKNKKSNRDRERDEGTETQKKKDKTEIDETAVEDTAQIFNEKMDVDATKSKVLKVDASSDSGGLGVDTASGSGALGKLKDDYPNTSPDSWDEDKFVYAVLDQEQEEEYVDAKGSGPDVIVESNEEVVTIYANENSVSAVGYLMEKNVVAVHVEASEDGLRRITCVTEDKSYIFELEKNPYLVTSGKVAEFFNWTPELKGPFKVFHGLDSKMCAVFFDKYDIILDGTKIYDIKIAYDMMKEGSLGDMSKLKKTGFSPDCIPVDTENVTAVCLTYLKAYQYFSKEIQKELKDYKKQLFKMVSADICKEDLKKLREQKKREYKATECSKSKSNKMKKMKDFSFLPLPSQSNKTEINLEKEGKLKIIPSSDSSSSHNFTVAEHLPKNCNSTINLQSGSAHPSLNNNLQQEFNETRQMARQCATQRSQEEQYQVIAVVKHESVEFPDGRRYTCRSTVVPDPVIVEEKSTATQTESDKCKDVGVQCEIIDWNKYQKMIELAEVLLK